MNNTIYGYNGSGILCQGTVSASNTIDVTIANNILNGDGTGAAVGIEYSANGNSTFALLNNGYFNNGGGDVVGGLINSGAVSADPQFFNVEVVIPSDTGGAPPLQGFEPSNPSYLNSGTEVAYDAIRAQAGDLDVDKTDTRSCIDIGAQQVSCRPSVLDWSDY